MAGANGVPTAATGLADLWPFECAAAAAEVAPGWNKKKCRGLLTNRISLYIFGYTRCGNVPAPKNEGKQMNGLKEYMVRYIPADDRYCTEKTIFVFAEDRMDAINRTLEADLVKKFIKVTSYVGII